MRIMSEARVSSVHEMPCDFLLVSWFADEVGLITVVRDNIIAILQYTIIAVERNIMGFWIATLTSDILRNKCPVTYHTIITLQACY